MQKPSPDPKRSKVDAYLKYSGMAFQMGIIILIFAWLGKQLDAYMGWKNAGVAAMSLLGVAAAMYVSLKDLFVKKDR